MPELSRRDLLAGAAVALAAARLRLGGAATAGAVPLPTNPFTLGVASGDPRPDRVVLWTRLAPDPLAGGGMPPDDVAVGWEVATDAGFTQIVASGTEPAVAALAHSVHVDADGLSPDTWYHYRFSVEGWTSPVGRTRTTPAPGARTPLRLGSASCQSYRDGYYTAHAHLAAEGCDLIAFLGDYIYEGGGSGPVRDHRGGEADTLAEYRNRYALYKADPDLQAAHAACPWVVVWDDHEVDNNYAGATAQDGVDEATFLTRRAQAYQAWWEHQPVRLPAPAGPDLVIHQRLAWGSLATLHLLDTRQFRSDQACGDALQLPCDGWDEPTRTLLGAEQEGWLLDGLAAGEHVVWDVLAQQIVFAPMPIGRQWNMDQWDGYRPQRDRVWSVLRERPNPVVLSGDIHLAAVVALHEDLEDAATARVGTEVVVGSISSRFTATTPGLMKVILEAIEWWAWANAAERGYAVLDLTEEAMHAEVRLVSTTAAPTARVRTAYAVDVDAVAVPPPPPPPTTTTTTTTSTSSTSTSTTSTTTGEPPPTSASSTSTTGPSGSSTTTASTTPAGVGDGGAAAPASTSSVPSPTAGPSPSVPTSGPAPAPAQPVTAAPRFTG